MIIKKDQTLLEHCQTLSLIKLGDKIKKKKLIAIFKHSFLSFISFEKNSF